MRKRKDKRGGKEKTREDKKEPRSVHQYIKKKKFYTNQHKTLPNSEIYKTLIRLRLLKSNLLAYDIIPL